MLVAVVAIAVTAASARAAAFFSPTGPWNAPVPVGAKLDANSGRIVSTLAGVIALKATNRVFPFINTTEYSTPIYRVGADTPKQSIDLSAGDPAQPALVEAIDTNGGVPFPAGAQPAAGTDGVITVSDASSHTLYEFWHASSPEMNAPGCRRLPWKGSPPCYHDSRWHADAGGLMDHADTDPGYFSVDAWPGLTGAEGYNWGATGTSLPFVGGLITFDDLNSGVIPHAVAGAFSNSCLTYFMAPAQRNDGTDLRPYCLPEGAKLQLDPAYNVAADANPPLTKAIERAAQTYGIIIQNNAVGAFTFHGQDPSTEPTNPYTSGPGVGGVDNGGRGYFGGLAPTQLFRNFPWRRLRVIASPHCTTAPCG